MTTAVSDASIVPPDETLEVARSVSSTELTETLGEHLQRLVDDHEAAANEPVRLDPGPPPFMVTLGDLRETAKGQSDALERIVEIVRQAEEDKAAVNPKLQADVIVEEKRRITEQAMERAASFFGKMADRSGKARACAEFYQPSASGRGSTAQSRHTMPPLQPEPFDCPPHPELC